MVDRHLLAGVDALGSVPLSTVAFRHVAVGRHPLSGAGARLHGGRAALDLSEPELSSPDATRCRSIGEAANQLGYEGVLAPSATGAGTVLAVFSDRLHADSTVREIDYQVWSAPPDFIAPKGRM